VVFCSKRPGRFRIPPSFLINKHSVPFPWGETFRILNLGTRLYAGPSIRMSGTITPRTNTLSYYGPRDSCNFSFHTENHYRLMYLFYTLKYKFRLVGIEEEQYRKHKRLVQTKMSLLSNIQGLEL